MQYPEDVLKAASEAMSKWWLSLEGHEAFGTRIPQFLTRCFADVIMAERERNAEEIKELKRFRSFAKDNADITECQICRGPRFRAYVCTHCGDDE